MKILPQNFFRKQGGFTAVEMILASTLGMMILISGFMLYRSQTKMQLKQSDVNEAQLTIDYVTNAVRTMVVSAGGGLPQFSTGIRKPASGNSFVTYVNRSNLASYVVDSLNTSATDGIIPISDATPFVNMGYAVITHDEMYALCEIDTAKVGDKTIKIKNPAAESALGGVDFAYPVEYCSLYVDTAHNLIKTNSGQEAGNLKIPLATQIDSLNISYDISADGNGTFTTAINDTTKISRVKLFIKVKGAHTLVGSTSRSYETIIGIRRGRLYNRAI